MSYVTPSTARTIPSSVVNSTARSRTDRTGSPLARPLPSGTDTPLGRIERVPQTVADEVDAEHDQHDRQAREGNEPPLVEALVLSLCDQRAEGGRRRSDAEAEVRQRRLEQDRRPGDQRRRDEDGADRVREHVPDHDPEVAGAGRLGSLDVLLLAQ